MKKIIILLLSTFLLTGCNLLKSDIMEDIDVYTTTYPNNYIIKRIMSATDLTTAQKQELLFDTFGITESEANDVLNDKHYDR